MTIHGKTRNGLWILAATILASSMAFIDGTVVNVALPALQAALHATVTDMQWVVEAYALLLASLLLLGGSLGDLYGRRKVFLFGVVVFAAASAWCGSASSIGMLIMARGLQGIGAAFLVPGSLSLISASFAEEERGRAIGTWSGFTAITAAIGPVLGGWLVEKVSWRAVFFINLPLALAVICLTLWRVPESRNESAKRQLDWKGATLATTSLGAITFALIEASRGGLVVWGCGVLGVAALCGFLFVEAHAQAPMIPLRLFHTRDFSGANLLTFLIYAPLSGILFFLPLDLIQVQHYSPIQAGAALLPLILLIFMLSRWSGGLVTRYGARMPLTVGSILSALGFALFLRVGMGGPYLTSLFPAVIVLGTGMAVIVAPLTTAVMESVSAAEAGVASGINNAVSRIAGLLAIALFGVVMSARFNASLTRSLSRMALSPAALQIINLQRPKLAGAETSDPLVKHVVALAFVAGFHQVIWISVGLCFLGSAIAYWLIGPERSPRASA